ncbi:hypothetical protein [Methanococcus maripaludis]|uniref:Uncharacterized protein n=1 Tax=Methanococcus maripaludis TaxID=39152 RepID=A0A7J9PT12_METMI|nr:hypothetical protein [Methanococcus maripaludis]MBA2868859.1 hypothetical protein [Methanococcus maripaludis]
MILGLFEIILNNIAVSRWDEKIIMYLVPIILTLPVFLIDWETIGCGLGDFVSSILTISALLVTFGVASITILFTSSSKNIEHAKEFYAVEITANVEDKKDDKKVSNEEKEDNLVKDVNGKAVNFFQLIIIRSYYAVVMEFLLIGLGLLSKIFLTSCVFTEEISNMITVFFEHEVPTIFYPLIMFILSALLLHAIIVLGYALLDIYYLMWPNKH